MLPGDKLRSYPPVSNLFQNYNSKLPFSVHAGSCSFANSGGTTGWRPHCSSIQTWVTMLVMSPVFAGSNIVFDSCANLEKALTYCSAMTRDAAALPCQKEETQKISQVTICFMEHIGDENQTEKPPIQIHGVTRFQVLLWQMKGLVDFVTTKKTVSSTHLICNIYFMLLNRC